MGALAKRAASFGELLIGYQEQNSIEKTVLNPPGKDRPCVWDTFDCAILKGELKITAGVSMDTQSMAFAAMEQRAAAREDAQLGIKPIPLDDRDVLGTRLEDFLTACCHLGSQERLLVADSLVALGGIIASSVDERVF